MFFGLLQRRECVVPTWHGMFLAIALVAGSVVFAVKNVYPFLAVTEPSPGGVLVIEGWASDYTMGQAIDEFRKHSYSTFLVTGGPIEKGAVFSEFKTYAEFGEATLEKMGVAPNQVHSVPAPEVEKDRTYASALALKEWLQRHNLPTNNVNVLTMGIHARRSRLLFERAFGPGTKIGITALEEPETKPNPKPWWQTSVGVRGMMAEVMAYIYARFLFNPNAI